MAHEGRGDGGEGQEVFWLALEAAVQASAADSQDTVRSTSQRCRPRCREDSTPLRARRCRMPREASHGMNIGFAA